MDKIILIGRPNVGKSSIFNRFANSNIAVVDDVCGVTRDWHETEILLDSHKCLLYDSAGIDNNSQDFLIKICAMNTQKLLANCQIILFVVDGKTGITQLDFEVADEIRKSGKEILLLINKVDNGVVKDIEQYHQLGFPCFILSSKHYAGFAEIEEYISTIINSDSTIEDNVVIEDHEPELQKSRDKDIQISVLGRPNAGKSSLINNVTNSTRLVTSDIAGTTRDSIFVNWQYQDYNIILVDTPGLRRKGKVTGRLEKLSSDSSIKSLNYSQIVLLVIDATDPFRHQDVHLANQVIKEGRAMVIIINKSDLIDNDMRHRIQKYFSAKSLHG